MSPSGDESHSLHHRHPPLRFYDDEHHARRSLRVQSLGQIADLHRGKTCACGQPLPECPFWGEVLASGVPSKVQLRKEHKLISREKGLPYFLLSEARCRRYARIQDRVFQAIFQETGAKVLVDSSKNITRGLALLRASRYDVRILHLVRDPRGFINSRNKRRREQDKDPMLIPFMAEWMLKNGMASTALCAYAGDGYCRVAYEDVMLRPQNVASHWAACRH